MAKVRGKPKAKKTNKMVSFKILSETIAATNEDLCNTIDLFNDMYKSVSLMKVDNNIKFPLFRDVWFSVKLLGDLVYKNNELANMVTVDGELRCDKFDMVKDSIELHHFSNVLGKVIVFNDLVNGTKVFILNDIVSSCLNVWSQLQQLGDDNIMEEFKTIIINFSGETKSDKIEEILATLTDEAERRSEAFRILNFGLNKVLEGRSAPLKKDITKGIE